MTLKKVAQGLIGIGFVGLGIALLPGALAEPTPLGEAVIAGVTYTGIELIKKAFE